MLCPIPRAGIHALDPRHQAENQLQVVRARLDTAPDDGVWRVEVEWHNVHMPKSHRSSEVGHQTMNLTLPTRGSDTTQRPSRFTLKSRAAVRILAFTGVRIDAYGEIWPVLIYSVVAPNGVTSSSTERSYGAGPVETVYVVAIDRSRARPLGLLTIRVERMRILHVCVASGPAILFALADEDDGIAKMLLLRMCSKGGATEGQSPQMPIPAHKLLLLNNASSLWHVSYFSSLVDQDQSGHSCKLGRITISESYAESAPAFSLASVWTQQASDQSEPRYRVVISRLQLTDEGYQFLTRDLRLGDSQAHLCNIQWIQLLEWQGHSFLVILIQSDCLVYEVEDFLSTESITPLFHSFSEVVSSPSTTLVASWQLPKSGEQTSGTDTPHIHFEVINPGVIVVSSPAFPSCFIPITSAACSPQINTAETLRTGRALSRVDGSGAANLKEGFTTKGRFAAVYSIAADTLLGLYTDPATGIPHLSLWSYSQSFRREGHILGEYPTLRGLHQLSSQTRYLVSILADTEKLLRRIALPNLQASGSTSASVSTATVIPDPDFTRVRRRGLAFMLLKLRGHVEKRVQARSLAASVVAGLARKWSRGFISTSSGLVGLVGSSPLLAMLGISRSPSVSRLRSVWRPLSLMICPGGVLTHRDQGVVCDQRYTISLLSEHRREERRSLPRSILRVCAYSSSPGTRIIISELPGQVYRACGERSTEWHELSAVEVRIPQQFAGGVTFTIAAVLPDGALIRLTEVTLQLPLARAAAFGNVASSTVSSLYRTNPTTMYKITVWLRARDIVSGAGSTGNDGAWIAETLQQVLAELGSECHDTGAFRYYAGIWTRVGLCGPCDLGVLPCKPFLDLKAAAVPDSTSRSEKDCELLQKVQNGEKYIQRTIDQLASMADDSQARRHLMRLLKAVGERPLEPNPFMGSTSKTDNDWGSSTPQAELAAPITPQVIIITSHDGARTGLELYFSCWIAAAALFLKLWRNGIVCEAMIPDHVCRHPLSENGTSNRFNERLGIALRDLSVASVATCLSTTGTELCNQDPSKRVKTTQPHRENLKHSGVEKNFKSRSSMKCDLMLAEGECCKLLAEAWGKRETRPQVVMR